MEFWMCLRILFQFKGCVKTYQEQSSEEKSSEEAIIPADEKGPTGTQREAQLANELSNLMMQLPQSVNERRALIEELEHLSGNLVSYKTRAELKRFRRMI
ncbi:hypothetical protein Tco_0811588 [Tanacetum coccineum]